MKWSTSNAASVMEIAALSLDGCPDCPDLECYSALECYSGLKCSGQLFHGLVSHIRSGIDPDSRFRPSDGMPGVIVLPVPWNCGGSSRHPARPDEWPTTRKTGAEDRMKELI